MIFSLSSLTTRKQAAHVWLLQQSQAAPQMVGFCSGKLIETIRIFRYNLRHSSSFTARLCPHCLSMEDCWWTRLSRTIFQLGVEFLTSKTCVCRGYFTDSSTSEMLSRESYLLCPADRSMSTVTRYFSLFLPTTKDIPSTQSWELWLPLFQSYWQTWGNFPAWEVDLLRL